MLKNLKAGDRFVDEIGRVFLVKKVISGGYETEFIGLMDYEEGQKPYKLDAEKSEDEKQEAGRKKGGRKTNKLKRKTSRLMIQSQRARMIKIVETAKVKRPAPKHTKMKRNLKRISK